MATDSHPPPQPQPGHLPPAQSSSSFAATSSSSSSYHPMLSDEAEPMTGVPLDRFQTTTPKHRATTASAWNALQPYQQVAIVLNIH